MSGCCWICDIKKADVRFRHAFKTNACIGKEIAVFVEELGDFCNECWGRLLKLYNSSS